MSQEKILREFGKIAPYVSKKGWVWPRKNLGSHLAVTRGKQLFNKNIGDRKGESLRTVTEFWPVAGR